MPVKSDIEVKGSLISYFSNLIKKYGGINLAQGIPGFMPPDKLMQSLANVSFKNYHQYAPGIGNLELVNFLENKYNICGSNSKLLITNGATEAISLIYNYLMSANGSNTFNVAAFSPAYESYIHLPRIFGHQFFPYLIDDSIYFDNQVFEEFFVSNKIKLLFVSSPGNPYGKAMSKEKLDFLVQLAEKNNSYLIIDAVYNELYFGEDCPYYPIEDLSPNVFYVNSFSKKFSVTGWRIGYFLMHESHFEKMCYTHDYIGLCVPAPLQQAMSDYLKTNNYQQYIDEIKTIIRNNYVESSELLTNNGFFCPNTDGGYFVWCRLPKGFNNSLEFGLKLYDDYKTAIIPGVHFGNEWNNYIRINIARQPNELRQGLANLISFVQSKS